MKISTLQSIIQRNSDTITNLEDIVKRYTKDSYSDHWVLTKEAWNYVSKTKKNIAKLQLMQKELKLDMKEAVLREQKIKLKLQMETILQLLSIPFK